MKNCLRYKGYVGSLEFSEEDAVFHCKVAGIKDLISFEGDNVDAITANFHNAVDEYLSQCNANHKEPELPFKGSFNVRIGTELHRKAALAASLQNISLNTFVKKAIRELLN